MNSTLWFFCAAWGIGWTAYIMHAYGVLRPFYSPSLWLVLWLFAVRLRFLPPVYVTGHDDFD
jgi:hypothetical protein